jgi:uncharacterized protein YegL
MNSEESYRKKGAYPMDTKLMPVRGEELPKPKTFEELIVLVLDASGSMNESNVETGRTNADDVLHHLSKGPNNLLQRMVTSRNRDDLYLGLVTFDHRVDAILPRPIRQFDHGDLDIPLIQKHGQNTAIGTALSEALRLTQDWISQAPDKITRFATILLMSDGQETENSDPLGVAAQIKSLAQIGVSRPQIVLATAAYGSKADNATLKAMATFRPDGSVMFKKVSSGEELRDFFIESIQASTPGAQL